VDELTAAEAQLPTAVRLAPLVLRALEELGGVASNDQIEKFVVTHLRLTHEQASTPHGLPGESGRTELGYRIAWARTKLRREGKIVNRSKGVWALARLADERRS